MNVFSFARDLDYLSSAFVLVPVFFFFKQKENFKNPLLILLASILILGGLTDLTNLIVYSVFKLPNIIIANTEFVIEFVLISLLFIKIYPAIKKIAIAGCVAFAILFLINSLNWQPIVTYQSVTRIAASVILISYSLAYFVHLMKELPADNLLKYTPFWLVTAFFFYFTMNLFVFSLSTFVFNGLPSKYGLIFYISRYFSEIIKDILFTVGIYYSSREKY